jgi:hypothetical protein
MKFDPFSKQNKTPASFFILDTRYSDITFQGIILDTGASRIFTTGKP